MEYMFNNSIFGDFNPRPREEGDKKFLANPQVMAISIHALVKRATGPYAIMFKR